MCLLDISLSESQTNSGTSAWRWAKLSQAMNTPICSGNDSGSGSGSVTNASPWWCFTWHSKSPPDPLLKSTAYPAADARSVHTLTLLSMTLNVKALKQKTQKISHLWIIVNDYISLHQVALFAQNVCHLFLILFRERLLQIVIGNLENQILFY